MQMLAGHVFGADQLKYYCVWGACCCANISHTRNTTLVFYSLALQRRALHSAVPLDLRKLIVFQANDSQHHSPVMSVILR